MSKTPASAQIANTVIADNPSLTVAPTPDEIHAALVQAARLGKISGLRRARKNARLGLGVEESIKRTYVALGADTDAYEADQRERHPERYGVFADSDVVDADFKDTAFSPDVIAGFAGMESFKLPGATVITADGISQS